MTGFPQVRMGSETAGQLESWLTENRGAAGQRAMDQLWLRAVLVEQRRRMPTSERDVFTRRADEVQALLDPLGLEGAA